MNEMTTEMMIQELMGSAGAAAGMAVVMVIALLAVLMCLIVPIIFGVLCKKIAGRKGYKGYFFTGFFLGMIGLVYVIGLPDRYVRKYLKMCAQGHRADEDED